ncbi:hypothetical protein [Halalkalibacterium ligniniphilum]|uniref:hypothetical protein n=1 Tax=Halalkalibacterium ligniniphilum TaxID=1134413 RepID=UPI0003689EBE|nr:hypothetical protein [Halalkalibacterium ligniniphilum]
MYGVGYFNNANYSGNHLHIDNFKDEFTPFIQAIAWKRPDENSNNPLYTHKLVFAGGLPKKEFFST